MLVVFSVGHYGETWPSAKFREIVRGCTIKSTGSINIRRRYAGVIFVKQ
jgi:hypothetical protein